MGNKHVLIAGAVVCVALALFAGLAQASEGPIKIGVMFVDSGPMGGYGKHGFQSVRLAVDEINASGGILGRKVTLLTADSKMQPPVGVGIAKNISWKTRSIS